MAKILKTSAEGRKCEYPHCTVTLSIYNHEKYCRVHLEKAVREQKAKLLTGPVSLTE